MVYVTLFSFPIFEAGQWPVPSVFLQVTLLVGFTFWWGVKVEGGLWVGITGRSFLNAVLESGVSSLYCPCECRLTGQLILDVF